MIAGVPSETSDPVEAAQVVLRSTLPHLASFEILSGKAVYPLVDASRATPFFVTSTMRNRALPCIIRA